MAAALSKEELLAEVEDVIRTMPERSTIRHDTDENLAWLGRVSAVIEAWDAVKMIPLSGLLRTFHAPFEARAAGAALRQIVVLLQQARHTLRMQTLGPLNVAIGAGNVFDYFDEVRKVIETAKEEIFFIDPYLDAEFVASYLGHVAQDVSIRLLAGEQKLATLLPAVALFAKQSGAKIEVHVAANLHDRYVIVDHGSCFQSGSSFKDGAKKAPTTLTQITDAFPAVLQTYEELWKSARVER